MLKPAYTTQFKKDFKLIQKRKYDINEFITVLHYLCEEKTIPDKYHDHSLSGNWGNHRELHIRPNWILIYQYINTGFVTLVRTGTHSDLLKI